MGVGEEAQTEHAQALGELTLLVQALVILTVPVIVWRYFGLRHAVPLVCVQILIGIALGPSGFGRVAPELFHLVFSPAALTPISGIASMAVWEYFSPGGNPRRGLFGIDTTRGDRLFISLLGSAFIFLGWLAFFEPPLWIPLGIAVAWFVFVFRWV